MSNFKAYVDTVGIGSLETRDVLFEDGTKCVEFNAEDIWLTPEQIKVLIKDLASRINYEVVLFGPETVARIKASTNKVD